MSQVNGRECEALEVLVTVQIPSSAVVVFLCFRRYVSLSYCWASVGASVFDSPPSVSVPIFRKPGAKFIDWECSESRDFFALRFDLAIIFLGGNDLAVAETHEVINKAKFFFC